MSQQQVLPASEPKAVSEVPATKRVFPKIVPSPQVTVEIVDVGKKRFGEFMGRLIGSWNAIPPTRKRVIALVGLSVFVSVAMSLIATIIARIVTRKPEVVAAK